jgi:hypothetical protein
MRSPAPMSNAAAVLIAATVDPHGLPAELP